MTVAFTGYRPEKMPFIESKSDENYMRFRKRQLQVIERLIERGCTDFISGVAMGFDIWAAEDVLSLQKKNKALTLECAIPFNGQADGWDKDYQKRRYKLLSHATSSVVLSDHFSDDCYFKRNRYMVDKADAVVFTRFDEVGTKTFSIVASRTWVFGLIFDNRVEAVRVNFVDHSDESDHVGMVCMGKGYHFRTGYDLSFQFCKIMNGARLFLHGITSHTHTAILFHRAVRFFFDLSRCETTEGILAGDKTESASVIPFHMDSADVIDTHHRATGTGRNLGVWVIHRDEFQSGAGFIIGFHSFGKLPFKSVVHMVK